MDRRSVWTLGSLLAFAAVCGLIALELRSSRSSAPEPTQAPALAAPQAPPSAFPAPTPGTTNETLHADLQEQTSKMGIQAIGRQDEEEPAPEPFLRPGEPGSREQAEETIRQIARMRKAVDRRAGKQDAVPIEGTVAPVLTQPDQQGGAAVGGSEPQR